MKRIGIFLGYPPEVSLRKEGISRLLGFIMKAAVADEDLRLVIACPKWLESNVEELLDDHQIGRKHIEILTTPATPALIRFMLGVRRLAKKGAKKRSFLRRRLGPYVKRMLYDMRLVFQGGKLSGLPGPFGAFIALLLSWLATPSPVLFAVSSLVLLSLVLLAFVPLLALGVVAGAAFAMYKYFKVPGFISRPLGLLAAGPARNLQQSEFLLGLYDTIRRFEFVRLIRLINKRQDIAAWYIPTLFWPEVMNIRAPKVLTAPDVVFLEFPSFFTRSVFPRTYTRMMNLLWNADALTCYSHYVRDKHLAEWSGINPENVAVIRHGKVDLRPYLLGNVSHGLSAKEEAARMRHKAIDILRDYQRDELGNELHFQKIDFSNTPFLFYSSQYRFYKNIFGLIQAFRQLRESYPELRLVLTANLYGDQEIMEYIEQHALYPYILMAHDIPTRVLAAFNHLAACAVTPTLFEGGFAFTFSEAYSVGTPSVMSNIPVAMELVTDPALQKLMLFDPYNLQDMVEKISFALENRELLLRMQKPLYESYPEWEDVARTYINTVLERAEKHAA
jgi:glycosyltransferase involved in cell wall biosynthesis